MNQIDLSQVLNKITGDTITATMWNGAFSAIQDKINELVAAIDSPISNALYINGVLHTERIITLAAGSSYVISGVCGGQIIIDAESEQPTANTDITLDGVTIVTSASSGIMYKTPAQNTGYKDLVITLAKDSNNYVVCTTQVAPADNQPGAIYSMNNLVIQGVGYLACHNAGGHGIRATEIRIAGPHIYVDAMHDAIHGKKISADYGHFYINSANDVFGTGEGGSIVYSLITVRTAQNAVQGYTFNAKDQQGGQAGTVKYYPALLSGSTSNKTQTSLSDNYGTPIVSQCDTEDGVYSEVSVVDGKYPITQQYVRAEGALTNTIYATGKVNITLNGIYSTKGIVYDSGSSRVKVVSSNGTYNIIDTQDTDAIKSENNIEIEVKNDSHLFLKSAGDGIDGGTVSITDSKGTLIVTGCGERGIKGNAIVIGPAATVSSSVITAYITDPTDSDYRTFNGAAIVIDNCATVTEGAMDTTSEQTMKTSGYADIYGRQGKNNTKGVFGTTDTELAGVLIIGSIGATINADLGNASRLYYNRSVTDTTITNDPGTTQEQYFAVPYNGCPISQ